MSTKTSMKATWQMDKVELARVFAEYFGFGVRGNWITRPSDGRAVACGWDHFAERLIVRGWIQVGDGVNWRKAGEQPTMGPATKTARGFWDTLS